jgi:Uma2 family endonuclease
MVVHEKLMTVEEFWAVYAGQPYELVGGRIVEVTPAGFSHGTITRRVGALLGAFVDAHGLGEVVGAETGFWINEHTLRAPDCAFVCQEKLVSITEADKYAPFAPDLAVEVVSPGDNASDIRDKVSQYRTAGTRLIWVIYPSIRKVDVYLPDGTSYEAGSMLDGGDVLSGLQLAVADLFPPE